MNNAAFLKEYRQVTQEIRMVSETLKRLGHAGRPGDVKGVAFGQKLPGTNDVEAAVLQQQDGLLEELQRLGNMLQQMEPRYQALYRRARHMQERYMMRHYYELLEGDREIAQVLGVTERHVRRLRQKLLAWLDEGEKPMSCAVLPCP